VYNFYKSFQEERMGYCEAVSSWGIAVISSSGVAFERSGCTNRILLDCLQVGGSGHLQVRGGVTRKGLPEKNTRLCEYPQGIFKLPTL
jgi:hypothetical protein